MNKYDYVRSEMRKDPGGHHCHWPSCEKKVAPAVWGCKQHWMMLPLFLRNKIWAAYRPTQEISKTPDRRYIDVAHEVQAWIATNYPPPKPPMEYDL